MPLASRGLQEHGLEKGDEEEGESRTLENCVSLSSGSEEEEDMADIHSQKQTTKLLEVFILSLLFVGGVRFKDMKQARHY